jgi:hypothetical protein
MKKLSIITLLLILTTSCTYEDVVNYLSGNPTNLTEEERQKVDEEQALMTTATVPIEEDKDKGDIKPPRG